MPRKFTYSPGMVGYGTRGVDGSIGLAGIATYFSAYDGNSDSVTIKSKITANKELFSTEDFLPGYPFRVYNNGDIFIDKNARIFQIDFNETNFYKDTGIFLNTSGFFIQGPTQTSAPEFIRYSNAFETDKFLMDTVYTNNVGNYTQYPTSIYDNSPLYFANVKYIGSDIVGGLSGYYPFQIWTIGSPINDNAIALVREQNSNVWRFGNYDSGSVRTDASLYLDFPDVYVSGTIHGIIDGTITTTNLYLPGWLKVNADTSLNNLHVIGDTSLNNLYLSQWLRVDGDTSISNSLYVDGSIIGDNVTSGVNPGHTHTGDSISALDTGDITSGIFGVVRGGTGLNTVTVDRLLTGNGTSAFSVENNLIFDGTKLTVIGDVSASTIIGANVTSGNDPGHTHTAAIIGDVFWGEGSIGSSNQLITAAGDGSIYAEGYLSFDGSTLQGSDSSVFKIEPRVTSGATGRDLRLESGEAVTLGGNIFLRSGYATNPGKVYIACGLSTDAGQAVFPLGSNSIPGIIFRGEINTGFYRSGPNAISITSNGSQRFLFESDGDFHADGNIIAYSGSVPSDIRLKENVKFLGPSLDKILELNGIEYDTKRKKDHHIGFIAQEVEKVIPEVIYETELIGEKGIYKTINYNEITPYITEAMKEQQIMIKENKIIILQLVESIKEQQIMIGELKKEIINLKNK